LTKLFFSISSSCGLLKLVFFLGFDQLIAATFATVASAAAIL